jgi:hypothetical protein
MKDLLILFRVQAKIATFLAELAADQLVALAEGRTRLTIVPGSEQPTDRATGTAAVREISPATAVPAPRAAASRIRPTSSFDAEEVAAQLRSCATVDQGTELLAKLKPRLADLRELARFLGISAGGTKEVLSKRVLTLTLGSRGKHAALTQG